MDRQTNLSPKISLIFYGGVVCTQTGGESSVCGFGELSVYDVVHSPFLRSGVACSRGLCSDFRPLHTAAVAVNIANDWAGRSGT